MCGKSKPQNFQHNQVNNVASKLLECSIKMINKFILFFSSFLDAKTIQNEQMKSRNGMKEVYLFWAMKHSEF